MIVKLSAFRCAILAACAAVLLVLACAAHAAESAGSGGKPDPAKAGEKPAAGGEKGGAEGKTPAEKPPAAAPDKPAGEPKPAAGPGKPSAADKPGQPAGPAKPAAGPGPDKAAPPPPPAADPAQPEPERPDPPEPLVPQISDLPPGVEADDWKSWATGQAITSLRRFGIRISGGLGQMMDGMAGNGADAPTYGEIFTDGPGFSTNLGVSFALLPVLSLGLDFNFYMFQSGERQTNEYSATWTDYYFDEIACFQFILSAKVRIPFAVWSLRKSHFKFSRAEEIQGFILFFQAGAGPAMMQNTWVEIHSASNPEGYEQNYYKPTTNLSTLFGGGIEIRWSWGGIAVEILYTGLGRPGSGWPPNSDSEPISAVMGRLSLAVYF